MSRTAYGVLTASLSCLLSAAACGDGLTEVNENPNAPTDVPVEFLLPTALASGTQSLNSGLMYNHGALWVQHLVHIQYPLQELGKIEAEALDYWWGFFYAGVLMDAQRVMEKGEVEGHDNAEAVGRIWKSLVFHIVTDQWGDVPFSEALKGDKNAAPAYDEQEEIYIALLEELAVGANALRPGGRDLGAGDLIYSNDFTRWRKFANSLRMRLAMRLSEVAPSTAREEFASAYSAGGFTGNEDNALLRWPGSPYENPLHYNYNRRDDHGISHTLVETLRSLNDPRRFLYAEPAASDGEYRGLQNGMDDLPPGLFLSDLSRPGNFWRRDGAHTPTFIMTYSEVLFLEAEAAARGWIPGDPATIYTQAIQANMRQYRSEGVGPSDSEIEAYLSQPEVAYTGIEDIYLQKWISLYMNGIEAWADWRRVGIPDLTPGPGLMANHEMIPVRLPYPPMEQSLNGENLAEAVARQGGGLSLVTPLWWDVR